MQFTVQQLLTRPDIDRIQAALIGVDPAALIDFDVRNSALRLSTLLEAADIVRVLGEAGLDVHLASVRQQPSECCGGCGG